MMTNKSKHSLKPIAILLSLLSWCVTTMYADTPCPLEIPGAENTRVGLLIYDLRGDSAILAVNADKMFTPASVMKSVTSAAVMMAVEPNTRIATNIVACGKISDGVLNGNLVVQTWGDPTIESRHFSDNKGFAQNIANALADREITKITGRVIIDESSFEEPGIPAGWLDEDVIWPYGCGLYGANFRDNTISLSMPSGESNPHVPGLKVDYVKAKGGLSAKRQRGSKTFSFKGTVPRKGHRDTYANPDPAATMRHEIETTLEKSGITISGKDVKSGKETIIHSHLSPLVSDILRSLMVRSDNMMAEGMLRLVSYDFSSRKEAIARERQLLSDAGLDVNGIVIEDGSGLSRNDRLSPRFLVNLYRYMLDLPQGQSYVGLFPRAGHDGTMRNFLKDTDLDGVIAMKTGSMRGIQSYSGFKLDENGIPTHAIAIMVNGFTCGRDVLKKEIQHLLLQTF